MTLPFNPQPKSKAVAKARTKPTQRQLGEISTKVRQEVKNRSNGACEVQKKCTGAFAREMAHVTSRKHLTHKTTAADILHSCVECHRWLDGDPEGIKFKRSLQEGNNGSL